MEEEKRRIRACPHCGSTKIEAKILFGGPMAQLDHKDGKFHCLSCGRDSVPLDFHNNHEVQDFKDSKQSEEFQSSNDDFLKVPIVPLNTAPLFTMGPLDLPIGKVARVVNVAWSGKDLRPMDFSVPFLDYWTAISGKRYNAHEMFMMDLSGIRSGKPNFTALKKLIKHSYEMWLDLGMRDVQDLFDSFAMDIHWAVASTLSCTSMTLFEEIHELSDKCVPCAYIDREIKWGKPGTGPLDLGRFIRRLDDIGFERVAVIDLARLGTREGYSGGLASTLEGSELEVVIGGGVRESDFDSLSEMGFRGALVDPFTPIIESIIEQGEDAEPVEHDLPSSVPGERKIPDALPFD